jgi:hypothetical protein
MPGTELKFESVGNDIPENYNFSLANYTNAMQFYPMMRYSDSKISYEIVDCPLAKKNNMEDAFNLISNNTILDFYPAQNGKILVTCDSKEKMEGGLFIAGEGGPSNVSIGKKFSVIFNGKIQLIKESSCPRPNIATHELLHALGFNHSENPNNVMYAVTNCKQTISQDIIDMINEIYSIPSYADIAFENVSATISGRYLDTEVNIRNIGLRDSEIFNLEIYAEDKLIKKIELEPIETSSGIRISFKNLGMPFGNFKELKFILSSQFPELDKTNNILVLNIEN